MTLPARAISAALVAVVLAYPARAQETVTEPSTEKKFPASVVATDGGKQYSLKLTGVTVRKKFIVKVYGMAHYMEDPPTGKPEALYEAMVSDGKAKQITMDFAREVSPEQIKGAYSDGFKENTTAEGLRAIQPQIDQLLGYFNQPVKENQQFILKWFPGGKIVPVIYGQEKPAITNPAFAKTLWLIWFGEESIVDREDLVERVKR